MRFLGSNLGSIESHLVAKKAHGKHIVFIALFNFFYTFPQIYVGVEKGL